MQALWKSIKFIGEKTVSVNEELASLILTKLSISQCQKHTIIQYRQLTLPVLCSLCHSLMSQPLCLERCVHSATSRRPSPFSNSGRSQIWCEAKGEKNMSYVTSGSLQIQFNTKVTEAETWQGHQSRSETGIISTSPPAHFSLWNSLQFNNLTLHTARVNSSKFQGEKVFIWNNHAHFSPHSRTSSLMVMPLKGRMWMDEHFALLLHTIYILNLAACPFNEKQIFIFRFASYFRKYAAESCGFELLCLGLMYTVFTFQTCDWKPSYLNLILIKFHCYFTKTYIFCCCLAC